MQTRVYLVNDLFWKALEGCPSSSADTDYSDDTASRELMEFLVYMDAVFPKGAYLTLIRSEKKVTLHNLPEQLDKIEKLLGPPKGDGTFYKKRLQ